MNTKYKSGPVYSNRTSEEIEVADMLLRSMIEHDPHITAKTISIQLGISYRNAITSSTRIRQMMSSERRNSRIKNTVTK